MPRVTINGKWSFNEVPCYCGACECGINSNMRQSGGKTYCVLFSKNKNYYDSPPKRCTQMFEGAFRIGGDVVLVEKGD